MNTRSIQIAKLTPAMPEYAAICCRTPQTKTPNNPICQCGSGKPALCWAWGPKVLFTIATALGHVIHCPSMFQHQRLLWFLVGLCLPRILLFIIPKRGVVLQLWVHGLGGWVLCVVLLLETVSE